jgi:hypothetical protein
LSFLSSKLSEITEYIIFSEENYNHYAYYAAWKNSLNVEKRMSGDCVAGEL